MAVNRVRRVLLRSAVYTASHSSPVIVERAAQSARFYLNVTQASGTGGLTFTLRGYDLASGLPFIVVADSAPIVATGLYLFEVAPAVATAGGNLRVSFSALLPIAYDVLMVHGDATNYTYSLSAELTN